MKPPKSILDRSFEWTPSHLTNIQERFDRIKREQQAEQRRNEQELAVKLQTIPNRRKQAC